MLTILRALRAYQWTKNLLIFAPLVFAEQLSHVDQVFRSIVAFACFCAASSATYLLNDVHDREQDSLHPEKRNRPIASGALPVPAALLIAAVLLAAGALVAYYLAPAFMLALLCYLILTTAYTFKLKHVIIVDVLTIAIGFVIRAMAGALALDVAFSNWLVVCTLFLALFLGLSKRRHEIELMEKGAIDHRKVLAEYSTQFIDALLIIVAGGALITYTIYTCSPEVVDRLGTDKLYLTLPFVVYGLFRYFELIHLDRKFDVGNPSKTLLKDWRIGLTVSLWGLSCIAIIYSAKL